MSASGAVSLVWREQHYIWGPVSGRVTSYTSGRRVLSADSSGAAEIVKRSSTKVWNETVSETDCFVGCTRNHAQFTRESRAVLERSWAW